MQHKATSTQGTCVVQAEILQRGRRPLEGFPEEACALKAERGTATAGETRGWGCWSDDVRKGRLGCSRWMGEIKLSLKQDQRVYKGQTQEVKAQSTEIFKGQAVCPK